MCIGGDGGGGGVGGRQGPGREGWVVGDQEGWARWMVTASGGGWEENRWEENTAGVARPRRWGPGWYVVCWVFVVDANSINQ